MSVRPAQHQAVTVISGATGGVGEALAEERRDDRLVLLGRDSEKLRQLGKRYPAATTHALSYTSMDAVSEVFAGIERIDRLVHCTGSITTRRIVDLDLELAADMMDASFVAPLVVTRAALPLLRTAGGMVVFISSGAAKTVRPGWAGYAAAKHAARALAEGIRVEEPQVRVLSIYCGAIDTPMRMSLGETREVDYAPGDYLDPVEVARTVSFAFEARPAVAIAEIDMRIQGR